MDKCGEAVSKTLKPKVNNYPIRKTESKFKRTFIGFKHTFTFFGETQSNQIASFVMEKFPHVHCAWPGVEFGIPMDRNPLKSVGALEVLIGSVQ